MHAEARRFIDQQVSGHFFERVYEFGSRNVNGMVEDLIDRDLYWGIDLADGPGVSQIADAAKWTAIVTADLVVCCEVLEHAPDIEGIIASAARNLRSGGLLLVTCACPPRAPHSGVDGGEVRDDEFYRNVDPQEFEQLLTGGVFEVEEFHVSKTRGDLYVAARRR